MRIAYIILAHNYPEQLGRLISKLNKDDVSFFIHIDKKQIAQHIIRYLRKFRSSRMYFFSRDIIQDGEVLIL